MENRKQKTEYHIRRLDGYRVVIRPAGRGEVDVLMYVRTFLGEEPLGLFQSCKPFTADSVEAFIRTRTELHDIAYAHDQVREMRDTVVLAMTSAHSVVGRLKSVLRKLL